MKRLFAYFIIGAMVLGVLTGWGLNHFLTAGQASSAASNLNLITDVFLRLIKMIIAPLVFTTLVAGIAHMEDAASVGRIGVKTMTWFIGASIVSLVLGLVIPPFAARLDREFARIGRLRSVPRMLGVLLWDIVQANVTVALQVLGPERKIRPGFIWVPLDIDNIHGIAALTSIITLTPGTVSSALSDDRRHLLVHVLNLDDADDVIRQIKTRYEAPLMEIFP